MRIKQVGVKDLFGMFNHVIPFNERERVTIIYGLNGIGKTAILRMINGFFNARYSVIRSTPFSVFVIWFDDGSHIEITKSKRMIESIRTVEKESPELFAEYHTPGQPPRVATLGLFVKPDNFPMHLLEEYIPSLIRVAPDLWRMGSSEELLTFEEIVDSYAELLPSFGLWSDPPTLVESSRRNTPDWLAELRAAINVRFVETQRLVATTRSTRKNRRESSASTSAVARYSEEIADMIQRRQAEYGARSQELDRTFPMRVLDAKHHAAPSIEELRQRLDAIEKRRMRLKQIGVLGKETNPTFQQVRLPQSADETTRNLLSVYVKDVEQKLEIFDDVAKRIETLIQFIREHFYKKQLVIDTERGFVIISTASGNELSLNQLSSGEQHELVLIYELLFRVKKNSLILIDEPEISLHVDWQMQFLDDIQNVVRLSPFDVLLATHSPMIINQRWDLTVELSAE